MYRAHFSVKTDSRLCGRRCLLNISRTDSTNFCGKREIFKPVRIWRRRNNNPTAVYQMHFHYCLFVHSTLCKIQQLKVVEALKVPSCTWAKYNSQYSRMVFCHCCETNNCPFMAISAAVTFAQCYCKFSERDPSRFYHTVTFWGVILNYKTRFIPNYSFFLITVQRN